MKTAKQLHTKWLKDSAYQSAYEALEDEFSVSRALIKARSQANLTQSELAARMSTSQAAVARLEAGKGNPSLATLKRYAKATGSRLKIELEHA
jgi:DNA-binding XRE family transcriptional regulator